MEKIWLKHYQQGVPETINPDDYNSINDIFDESCKKFKNNDAFANMGKHITFEELDHLTRNFAAYLQNDLKLQRQERIAIMMPNLLQYPIAMFGAIRAGLVIVNTNPLYTTKELEVQLKDSGATTIVILENFAHTLEKVLDKTDIKNVIVTKISDMFSFPKSLIINFAVKYIKKMVPKWNIPNHIEFNTVINKGGSLPYTDPKLTSEDIAFLQYTGGTTGGAKGAILTHRNMVANVQQASAWLEPSRKEYSVDKNGIIITAIPLYHIFALTANCLTFMKFGALNVLITNPRDLDKFIGAISKYKFSAITGVNTLFNAMLHHPKFASLDFSNLAMTLGGGMAVQKSVAEQWKKVTGKPLIEAYGLTETSPAACMNPMNLTDYNGYIGVPISSTEAKVVDDSGNELGLDEPGELCIKGPQVMRGYWNKEEETAKVLDKDGWFKTGDIATINPFGFVKIVDRKKDMILVSGFNVYPNEVEDVIAELEAVKEVAVIGVKNGVRGEAVKAFVVKNNEVSEEEIKVHCKKSLTNYKIPKYIEFKEDLPKTNVGKILRRELREN